jgi:hypothetical protein
MRALCIHRLMCIRRCCKLSRRSPCLALRASSVETLRHRTCVVRKMSRGGLQRPLYCVFGDAANCPGVPLVWPCVLPQWRPCVTGLGVRKISRGGLQHPLHCVFGDAANCPGVPLVWPCVLPQWRPCVTGLGVRKISRGGLQHPLHCVFGDVANCPGVSLVWPCVLPQWRPCVTGLGVRKITRGDLLAAPVARNLETGCGLPWRFPCLVLRASSVETLHHRTCGIRKRSRRLQYCVQTLLTICY